MDILHLPYYYYYITKIKPDAKPLDINIIQVYVPTSDSIDEELDKFYSELETAMKQCK